MMSLQALHPAGELRPSTGNLVIVALGLATFISLLSVLGLGPFLPSMAAELGTNVSLLGQIPALITLLAAVLGLVVGPLADWIGYRRSLLLGLATIATSTVGFALAPSYLVVLAVALVGAIGRASIGPVCQAIAGERFTGETRRRALSWVAAGISGAGIVGIPFLTSLDAMIGWRGAFSGLALLVVVSLLLARLSIAPDRAKTTERPRLQLLLAAYAPLLGHRSTLGLIGASILSSLGVWSTWIYLGAFYIQQHGFSTQAAGWVYMIVSLGLLLGSLVTGGRLGRLPLRPLLIVARVMLGLLMAATLVLPVTGAVSIGLMTLSAVMLGIGFVATITLLTGETPAGRATTMALNQSALSLGTALGSSLGGLLLAVSGYMLLGLSALLWCILSAGLIWWSRPAALARLATTQPALGE